MGRCLFFGLFVLVLFAGLASAALGISPAKLTYDFVPGMEHEIEYTVISDRPDQVAFVYSEGALGELVGVSREKVVGEEQFVATLRFPQTMGKPGRHRIYVVASEQKAEGIEPLGSAVTVRAVIEVFVPYPGQYVDVALDVSNGNVDETIPLVLKLESLGTENVTVSPRVEVFDRDGTQVATRGFDSFLLPSRERKDVHAEMSTMGWKPGEFLAVGKASFAGQTNDVNKTFLVGSLFVNVTNHTERLVRQEGIQKFLVNVESRWNGALDEVFAEVNLSNEEGSVFVKTPSVSLRPWEFAELVAFVDTDELDGVYQSEIVVRYAGVSTRVFGLLEVGSAEQVWMWVLVLVVVALFLWKRSVSEHGKQDEKR
ncbi:hypothetical protein CMI48_01470 [Candidatus Pacearchaeota archaeon]|nr:hypothetical protein [Candidatus Pacearchaeota archaeon]